MTKGSLSLSSAFRRRQILNFIMLLVVNHTYTYEKIGSPDVVSFLLLLFLIEYCSSNIFNCDLKVDPKYMFTEYIWFWVTQIINISSKMFRNACFLPILWNFMKWINKNKHCVYINYWNLSIQRDKSIHTLQTKFIINCLD